MGERAATLRGSAPFLVLWPFDNVRNMPITWTNKNDVLIFDEKQVGLHLRHFRGDVRWNGVELNVLRHCIADGFGSIRPRFRHLQVLQHNFPDYEPLLGSQVDGAWGWANFWGC